MVALRETVSKTAFKGDYASTNPIQLIGLLEGSHGSIAYL